MTKFTRDKIPPFLEDHLNMEQYQLLVDAFYDGWTVQEIRRHFDLPESKNRSLQTMAAQWGPHRRVSAISQLKDLLAGESTAIGQSLVTLMQRLNATINSEETKPSTQIRAGAIFLELMNVVLRISKDDQDIVAQQHMLDGKDKQKSIEEGLDEVLNMLGIDAKEIKVGEK